MRATCLALLFVSVVASPIVSAEDVVPNNWCQWPDQTYQGADPNEKPAASPKIYESPDSKKKDSCSDSREYDRAAQDDQAGWTHFWTDPIKTSNLVIALFTVVLAVSTIFLWVATKRAAQATLRTVDTMRATERGWMKVVARKFGFFNTQTYSGLKGPYVELEWMNVGRSTCITLSASDRFLLLESLDKLPVEPDFSENSDLQMLLKPDETFTRTTKHLVPLTSVEERDIRQRKLVPVHIARIRYRDAFGEEHETRVFYYWKVRDDGTGEWKRGEKQHYSLQT